MHGDANIFVVIAALVAAIFLGLAYGITSSIQWVIGHNPPDAPQLAGESHPVDKTILHQDAPSPTK